MKRLGITQRVMDIPDYGERRDGLDQRWSSLSLVLNYAPIPLCNIPSDDSDVYLDTLSLDGIILSGGNSLSHSSQKPGDRSPERDAFEGSLIDYAIKHSIPVVGICRGMQMINVHFHGSLRPIEGHAGTRHGLKLAEGAIIGERKEVNSYHNWGVDIRGLGASLVPMAFDQDGNVEAFVHAEHAIAGIMWHPERENPFLQTDLDLIRAWLT